MNQKQQIFFKEIRVEDTITLARGDVATDKVFHIDSKFDLIIVDEAHYISNTKAQRTKIANEIINYSPLKKIDLGIDENLNLGITFYALSEF